MAHCLREEGTSWLIKCPGEGNLSDVGHFNTSSHVRMTTNGQTRGQQQERKAHHRKKSTALIPCKSLWAH
jgi:hypothetical protein